MTSIFFSEAGHSNQVSFVAYMIVKDQMGRRVDVPEFPQRIISLVPSQTELLFNLGLEDRVVGVTKFCIHPEMWRQEKTIVGGTKQVNFDVIESMNPDLIIGNKEENDREFIEQLSTKFSVWMSDIHNLNDALDMIEMLGEIVNKPLESEALVVDIIEQFEALTEVEFQTKKTAYLIWRKPFMAAGQNTFINDMMKKVGFENVITEDRYPELSLEAVQSLQPEVILLSSEPYPFKSEHLEELKVICPVAEIKLVDGEMFSWYGSRLLKAPTYFKTL